MYLQTYETNRVNQEIKTGRPTLVQSYQPPLLSTYPSSGLLSPGSVVPGGHEQPAGSVPYPTAARSNTISSIAAATPLALLGKVIFQFRARNCSEALPMITGTPAYSSISMSL